MDQFTRIRMLNEWMVTAVQAQREIDRLLDEAKATLTTKAKTRSNGSGGTNGLQKALQGKYMGAVRGLSKKNFERVRNVREKEGFKAAISLANTLKQKRA